jgi:RNA polymerase sigma factor (sigma-70 family)
MRNKGVSARDFEDFYSSQKDRCYRALLATVEDPAEADDLLSEAFTRAWREWDEVRRHPAPNAWVVRTALNLHRDRFRRRTSAKRHLVAIPASYEDVSTEVDPSLLIALRALPEQQRLVIALRVLLDLDTSQTALALGIAPGTVTTHLKR